MSEWEVYWWLKLDAIGVALTILSILLVIVNGFCLIAPLDSVCLSDEKNKEEAKKVIMWGVKIIPVTLLVIVTAVLAPSTKEYAVIKVLPKVVNSDFAKEAVGDAKMIYDVAKNYLKETLRVEAPDAKG